MSTLIELEQIRDALVEQILSGLETETESEGLTAIELEELLSQLESKIANKVDAIAAVVTAKNAEIAYLKERRDYFDKLIKTRQNALDRFKDYLKSILERRANSTIIGKETKLRLVKNGGKQPVWINPDLAIQNLPPELVKVETSYAIDSDIIREKLAESDGELTLDGQLIAKLEERGTHLRIG
jgi:hypothetical protein